MQVFLENVILHLHRARQEEDRHRHGRSLRSGEAGQAGQIAPDSHFVHICLTYKLSRDLVINIMMYIPQESRIHFKIITIRKRFFLQIELKRLCLLSKILIKSMPLDEDSISPREWVQF